MIVVQKPKSHMGLCLEDMEAGASLLKFKNNESEKVHYCGTEAKKSHWAMPSEYGGWGIKSHMGLCLEHVGAGTSLKCCLKATSLSRYIIVVQKPKSHMGLCLANLEAGA